MTPKLFPELGLSPEVLKAIAHMGFEQASPIQAATIPVLLKGGDVVGQSHTGSGKTAAFAVPAIEKVDPQNRAVQILILCPTRELAVQVSEEVHKLAAFKKGVRALPVYGGQSYERQFQGLRAGAQIVIGTPGRVMDHMRRGTLRLDQVRMAILDEADVMLDMGFRDDIEIVLKAMPPERQTVFFSATLPRPIQELIRRFARDPQMVRIENKSMTVSTVEQVYYEVNRHDKVELITRLIDIHDFKLGIIFCNTKRMVDDLVGHLNAQGYSAEGLHGDMNQSARDRVMNKFRKSGLEFLVATDVAARGIDVDDVQVVFNFDLPYDAEDYVHRIGRTGRAGRSGRAIAFVSGREVFQIQNIERFTRTRIQRSRPPTADQVEEARANVFVNKLRSTLQGGKFKRQDALVERLLEEGFSSTDIASALLGLWQGGEGAAAAPTPSKPKSAMPKLEEPLAAPRAPYQERPAARPVADRAPRPERPAPAPARAPMAAPVRTPSPAPARAPSPTPARVASPAPAPTASPAPAPVAPAPTPAPAPIKAHAPKSVPAAAVPEKASRRTPDHQTRLFMTFGEEMGATTSLITGTILAATDLPREVVGIIDIRARHTFVDVAKEHATLIVGKLHRTRIKGHFLKVREV